MSKSDIENSVLEFVKDELLNDPVPMSVNDDLLQDGLVDSVGMMWLIQHLEELFDTTVPAQDVTIENFGTAATIAVYFSSRLNGRSNSGSGQA